MKVQLDTKAIRSCGRQGCAHPAPFFRHHLGNDGLLAAMGYLWSRRTYHTYYSCRDLCDECHMMCHYIYEVRIPVAAWHRETWLIKETPKRFKEIRNQYIRIGKLFLEGKILTPQVPPEYKEKWQRSKSIWLARRSAQTGKLTQPLKRLDPKQIRFDHE